MTSEKLKEIIKKFGLVFTKGTFKNKTKLDENSDLTSDEDCCIVKK